METIDVTPGAEQATPWVDGMNKSELTAHVAALSSREINYKTVCAWTKRMGWQEVPDTGYTTFHAFVLAQLGRYLVNDRGKRINRRFEDAKRLALADANSRYVKKETTEETTYDCKRI